MLQQRTAVLDAWRSPTGKIHVANIIGKLGSENRREAAAIAARLGLA
jgi:DNA-binding CsgD family transcriptional regulator